MALIYHNITPPEYFVGVHRHAGAPVFPRPARAAAPTPTAAIWRWATRSSTARISRRSGFHATAVLPVVPDFLAPRSPSPTGCSAQTSTTTGRTSLFVGRVIANKKIEDRDPLLPRVSHALQPALAAAHRRRAERLRTLSGIAHISWPRRSASSTCTSSATSRTRSWSPSTTSPICFLCASEHEGFCVPLVEAFYKQVPVLAYAATAVPVDDGRRRRALRRQGPGPRRAR